MFGQKLGLPYSSLEQIRAEGWQLKPRHVIVNDQYKEAVVEAVSGSLASVSPAKLEAALILERSQTQRRPCRASGCQW